MHPELTLAPDKKNEDVLIRKLPWYTPASRIFDYFHSDDSAVFLDSSLEGPRGKHSIIGLNPYLKLVCHNKQLFVNGTSRDEDFGAFLSLVLKENRRENSSGLPVVSGAIGYFSYDYGMGIEKIKSRHKKELDIPDCIWNFYDNFIIEDLEKREIYITGNGMLRPAGEAVEMIERTIAGTRYPNGISPLADNTPSSSVSEFSSADPWIQDASARQKEDFTTAVEKLIDYIMEGDVYIANLTGQFRIKSGLQPYEAFKRLRLQTPSPFGGYMNYGEFQIVSASPESFLRLRGQDVTTVPIKGTRKRSADPKEDLALRTELEHSEKDKSELLMIVDLERNDLNRVCLENSVRVKDLFKIEEYSSVFHLTSEVCGTLRPGTGIMDLIQAAFPGGSITGAPKIRAMEIIDELETAGRGIYTGSMGYISLNGDCALNIIIRTALFKDGCIHIGAGGGITCESDPEFEYEEALLKAGSVIHAITNGDTAIVPHTKNKEDCI